VLSQLAGEPLAEALAGARFLSALPSFFRRPISPTRAREIVRVRLAQRSDDLLVLARHAIYAQPASPYRALLRQAGCDYADLERLVAQQGLEAALRTLFQQGVYLTVDELKGRRPAVRGGLTVEIEPAGLRNPLSKSHLLRQSSGSRGERTTIAVDLEHVRDCAIDTCLAFEARGSQGWRHAFWTVPGSSAIVQQLHLQSFGARPERCFLQVDPSAPGLHPRYAWSGRAVRWVGAACGVRLPRPEVVPLDDPLPIARWMAQTLRAGATPHLVSFVSPAVRLCQAAAQAGLDLRGAALTVGGEPTTAARLGLLQQAGLRVMSGYASTEAGGIATDCLAPAGPDDLHLQRDRLALIQPGGRSEQAGLPPLALLATSLRPTTPLILLNASLGDQALLSERVCGCPLEGLGWTTHLQHIRSFEKLTAGGMTFLDSDVIQVLERDLPARFGGGPTDYQLLETESRDGAPRLKLLVEPALGPLDEAGLVEAFLESIGAGSGAERVMALQWRQAGWLEVERRRPLATATGKVQHVHLDRETAPPAPAINRERPASW
jgi:hypothetical protein